MSNNYPDNDNYNNLPDNDNHDINDHPNNRPVIIAYGENGHAAYSTAPSSLVRDRIVQFNFQLVRTTTVQQMVGLELTLTSILETLYKLYVLPLPNPPTDLVMKICKNTMDNIFTLYKLIGHTRDIIDGKGEYTLTYMMIYVWNKFWPELAQQALYFCVHSSPTSLHPYGSWKDIKYFCNYLKHKGHDIHKSSLINYAITLLNAQLYADHNAMKNGTGSGSGSGSVSVSMAAKWAPREKSARFGWLFTELARAFYCIYECTANTTLSKERAIIKSKTDYRKLLSSLNKHIDTVQIHQCANNWASIKPHSQTSITLHKQKYAFLNINKDCNNSTGSNVRYPLREDRIICSQNFQNYISSSNRPIKGSRVGLHHFIKDAIHYIDYDCNDPVAKTLLNMQWLNSASNTKSLQNMIAMVDVSGSMDGDPLHCAIGLGIRVAEKSALGPRILTFSSKPQWINLDKCIHPDGNTDLIECVKTVQTADWGMNTNFYAALSLILDQIVAMKMLAKDVKELVLAIFTDMQIDCGDPSHSNHNPMMDQIREKYAEAGIRCCGEPYDPPHILFWNLRSTDNFPTLTNQLGATMMSGFNPALLNAFCQDGIQSLHSCTPYNVLQMQLENPRYTPLENACSKFFHDNQKPFIPGIGW
jgi:hypothetical protein